MEDNEIPRMRKPLKEHEYVKQIAKILKRRLILLIAFLITILLVLIFQVGQVWWPAWIIEHHKQIEGILLLVILCLILLSPVISEADSNPRPLSGPGKRPGF